MGDIPNCVIAGVLGIGFVIWWVIDLIKELNDED